MDISALSLSDHKRVIWEEIEKFGQSFYKGELDFSKIPALEWNGHTFIKLFNPDTAKRFFEDVEIEKDFVLIANFPKTGTMWTYEIVRNILYGHDDEQLAFSKNMPPLFQILSLGPPGKIDLLEDIPLSRKFCSTHLPANLVNFEKLKRANAKIIVVVRNPKDQAVSLYHFVQCNPHFEYLREKLSFDWPSFIQDYVDGKYPTFSKAGEWYPHYLHGWYQHANDDNVTFVHFEDIKRNPTAEIKKIADFLNVRLSEDRLKKVVEATSFKAMKKEEAEGETEFAKVHAALNILRKGKSGSWKDTFTVAQAEMMDKVFEEKLGSDIKFRYS